MGKWTRFSLCLLLLIIHGINAQPGNNNLSYNNENLKQRNINPDKTLKYYVKKNGIEKPDKEILTTIRKYKLIYTLVILTSIFALTFLYYRNFKHKKVIAALDKDLQNYKARELDYEKTLSAAQRILQEEENIRKGLARDLQDNLGGTLSGIKIALNNMKGNAILTCETVNDFNHALNSLDNSIDELRYVALNMMPEALIKLGLKDTLADLITELDKIHDQQIIFQFCGQFKRIDSSFEMNAYILMRELIMNIIRNHELADLVVQMMQEPDRICFMLMYNGTGLDLSKETDLHNISARVDAFNGQMEINATPGNTTEIAIEFAI